MRYTTETTVYNGIPIRVEIEEKMEKTIMYLRGQRKEWKIESLSSDEFWSWMRNVHHSPITPGETTALVAVGMQQLQRSSDRRGRPITYQFSTSQQSMVHWY